MKPVDAGTYNNRGDLKTSIGNFDGAMADIKKAIELDLSSPTYHITLAELYDAMANAEKDGAKKSEYLENAKLARAKAKELE